MGMNKAMRFLTSFCNFSFFLFMTGFWSRTASFLLSESCVCRLCSRKLFLVNAAPVRANGELSLSEAGGTDV